MNYRAGTRAPSAWAAPRGEAEPDAFELQAASLAPLTAAILKARRGSPEPRYKSRPQSSHSQRSRGNANGGFFSGLSSQPSAGGNLWSAPHRSSGGVRSGQLGDGGVPTTALEESIARLNVLQSRLKRGAGEPASERASGGSLRRGLLSPPTRKDDVSSAEAAVASQRKASLRDEIQSAERALNRGVQKAAFTTPEGEVKRVIRVDEAPRPLSAARGINRAPIDGNVGPISGHDYPPFSKQDVRRHSIGPLPEAPRGSSDAANRRHSSDGGRPASAKTDAAYPGPYPSFDSRGVQDSAEVSFGQEARTPGLSQSWTGQRILWSTQVSRGDSLAEGSGEKRVAATEGNAERQRPISYPDGVLSQSLTGSTTGGSLDSLQARVSSLEAERGPLEGRLYEAIGRMSASMERAFQQRVERLEATMHDAVAEAVAFLGKKATADARSEIEKASADAQMAIDKKLGPAGMERLARRAVWLVGGKMGARATALEAKAARALTVAKRTESQLRQLEATHKLSDGHVSHLTAKIKKLKKDQLEAAGPAGGAPACGCAGLCKGLSEGLESVENEVAGLRTAADRREHDTQRNENGMLRKFEELRGERRGGKAEEQFAVLARRVEELEQELGCKTEAEQALQRNGELVAELRKRIDVVELAQPADKAIDEMTRSQRRTEGELSRLQVEFRSEMVEAGKRNDRNVRAELAKARQDIVGEISATLERERESVRRTVVEEVADRTAELAESVRRIADRQGKAEADSTRRAEALEDRLKALQTKLGAEVDVKLADLRNANGTGKEVEKLRECVEALQSVSDETTERLAEAEEGLEGAKAAATEGLEGLRGRVKGLEERVLESIAVAQRGREEGIANTGDLQEGLNSLRGAVVALEAAAAAAEQNPERLESFQKELERLQQTVQKLEGSASAKAALGVDALQAELDGVKASVTGLEESLSQVKGNAGLETEALRNELSKTGATVAALDAFASEMAAEATLERSGSAEARKLLEKRLEDLTERVNKSEQKSDGTDSDGVHSLRTDVDGLADGVKVLQADVARVSDGVNTLRTDLGGVSDSADCMRTELDVLKEVLLQLENKVNEASSKKEVSKGGDAGGSLRDDVAALRSHVAGLEASVQEARSAEVEAAGSKESLEDFATRVGYLESAVEEVRARKSSGDVAEKQRELREEFEKLKASVEAMSANGKVGTDGSFLEVCERFEGLEARVAAAAASRESFGSKASVEELRDRLEELEGLGDLVESVKAELGDLRDRQNEGLNSLRGDVACMEGAVKEVREKLEDVGGTEKLEQGTGQNLTGISERLEGIEAGLGELRGREEENEGRLGGLQEQVGELAESVEDAQRKGAERARGLEERVAKMVEEGKGVEEELEAKISELRDRVARLGSSVEALAEQRKDGEAAERERTADLRVKLIENEADGLKQAVEVRRQQQTESAGTLDSVRKQVGNLLVRLSDGSSCPLHNSVEELKERNAEMDHSLEEVRLKMEGMEDDLRRQIGGGHVEQQVERLALAVGKLAETCARDHEALAAGICRHHGGQGVGINMTSIDDEVHGEVSRGSTAADRENRNEADWSVETDGESFSKRGNLVGGLFQGETADSQGSPAAPEAEPGDPSQAQSWDDIGAQLATVRQSLSGKVVSGTGIGVGSGTFFAAAWATAQSEAGLNPLYELGAGPAGKVPGKLPIGRFEEEGLEAGARAVAAAPPPLLLMHENLLYQTPISPPSNATSPADVTMTSTFGSRGNAKPVDPAQTSETGVSGSSGASAPSSGLSAPSSGVPASGTHVPRRPPSLKLDALPGIVPSDLALRPKSPLGRKSRAQAGFSDRDWTEPPKSAVEVPASLPFARDSLSYLTSPVSPGGGTPSGTRTEFRERKGWAGANPEKAPSPVCPSPGVANEFLDPKELTPSPSPADTGSGKPADFEERTETATGRSRRGRGSPGSDHSRDSLEGENDVSVLPNDVSGGPPSPGSSRVGGQSPTAGLKARGQIESDPANEPGKGDFGKGFDGDVPSASSAADVRESANALPGLSARQSPRPDSASRYGRGKDSGDLSDSQSDVSDHDVDVGEEEIREEMDDWDLGVEGLEDVLGSD
ncbi:hypothetical protein KFL_000330410 [Klebsormidium nitens]|uniref:Uncharacterized protein n=1 Tax=Klebsormidium nitens TaxID=105231 RepID=A0A1Y1HLT7_KLENI|nr:hypothetical protein KFL_000330410 [Klebsormidium nitens]|eukprot:GAQ79595.1 hypothetical protein KFL_000330410 [Klebsormidium nitens]